MSVYEKLLEKAADDAKKSTERVRKIEKVKNRADQLAGVSDAFLRRLDNSDAPNLDAVGQMLSHIFRYARNEGVPELRDHAFSLRIEMTKRKMNEATYNALADGTHSIYQQ